MIATLGFAAAVATQPVDFTHAYKANESRQYEFSLKGQEEGFEVSILGNIRIKVLKTADSGGAAVEFSSVGLTMSGGGMVGKGCVGQVFGGCDMALLRFGFVPVAAPAAAAAVGVG